MMIKSNNKHQVEAKSTVISILLTLFAQFAVIHAELASSTIVVRPSSGRATLIPGQPLHFECKLQGEARGQFIWFVRAINDSTEILVQPEEELVEIHNQKLTLLKPNSSNVNDYICRSVDDQRNVIPTEFAVIKVRQQPYIEDFGRTTSHTGKSSVITDGERLELTCTVRDSSTPVNITWLHSMTPDDDRTMIPLAEQDASGAPIMPVEPSNALNQYLPSFLVLNQNIIIEKLSNHSKRLVIESAGPQHRSYYICIADNGITERARKVIFIRVKDKLVALWPFLGIVAELVILFTIIHIWETQRAYRELQALNETPATGSKRPASGASGAFENVPLTAMNS